MGLVKCPKCGRSLADRAMDCPRCMPWGGTSCLRQERRRGSSRVAVIVALAVVVLVLLFFAGRKLFRAPQKMLDRFEVISQGESCLKNLQRIGFAVRRYAEDNGGWTPVTHEAGQRGRHAGTLVVAQGAESSAHVVGIGLLFSKGYLKVRHFHILDCKGMNQVEGGLGAITARKSDPIKVAMKLTKADTWKPAPLVTGSGKPHLSREEQHEIAERKFQAEYFKLGGPIACSYTLRPSAENQGSLKLSEYEKKAIVCDVLDVAPAPMRTMSHGGEYYYIAFGDPWTFRVFHDKKGKVRALLEQDVSDEEALAIKERIFEEFFDPLCGVEQDLSSEGRLTSGI